MTGVERPHSVLPGIGIGIAAVLLGLWLGAQRGDPALLAGLFDDPMDPRLRLLIAWRLPRVLAAWCVGACLGIAGVLFQGLFRNPLAEPFLLGGAPGAALGATIALLIPLPLPGPLAIPLLAFAGAWGATAGVVGLARLAGVRDAATLLLAGVAVSAVLAAVRSLLMLALTDESVSLQLVLSWTLGGIATPHWPGLGLLALLTALALMAGRHLAPGLDLLGLGDDVARNMGLPLERFQRVGILVAAAVTAVAVAAGGLVAFVGLVIPHMVRWRIGPLHRPLCVHAALAGGAATVVLDAFARSLMPPADIPLGLLTAMIGAPVFIVILIREQNR
ncbi:MAG: iron ABC transporter permease [Telmatospirillum sp.]|nr:iron ABC transporter permease [Telmatospirillum sp.]